MTEIHTQSSDARRTVAPQQSGERFCLTQDNDGHWYVIPVARQQEWEVWLDLDEDDEAAWEPPSWANRTYGAPSLVSFTDPLISIV